MKRLFLSALLSVFFIIPISAQKVNSDSLKAEMDKIELSNPAMKQMIDRYKKGVIKGVKKGTCYVYVYTQDGISQKIKVKVK